LAYHPGQPGRRVPRQRHPGPGSGVDEPLQQQERNTFMNNNNKPIVLVLGAIGALLALSLVVRFLVLSQFGVPGGSIFYFGLPIGGIVALALVLMRLGLLNFGDRSSGTIQTWQHHIAMQGPSPASPSPAASTSQRLEELETLHTSGTISDVEYSEERARIISSA
jgi:hypothetical protein